MSQVSPQHLSDQLSGDGEGPLILDIRPEKEFEDWHIPNSVNVDVYDELDEDAQGAQDELAQLPRDREIVTVCAAGIVSQKATAVLRAMGYEAITLTDGMRGWSRVHRHAPVPVTLEGTLVQVARPGKGCLSHVLVSRGEAAVFDPSAYVEEYEAVLDEYDAHLVGVFDSHAHADHVSGGRRLADRHDVPYYLHPADAIDVEATPLEDGQTIAIGNVELEILHTPGHSAGGVTFDVESEALLTGDTLFHESVGRVELGVEVGIEEANVEDNAATLYESLQRLRRYDDDVLVLPAHDPGTPMPPVMATLGEVVARNADLGRDRATFIERLASDIPDHPPNFERVKRANVGLLAVELGELSDLEFGPNNCAAE